jgi:hypothetical protein
MISEKRLAEGYSRFWQESLPMLETYIRAQNLGLARFAPPMRSITAPGHRGLINEIGFRLYVESVRVGLPIDSLSGELLNSAVRESEFHVREMRQHSRKPLDDVDDQMINEARVIGKRLSLFLTKQQVRKPVLCPKFNGCGLLDECAGDVYSHPTLYEIKAGDRSFRSVDVRQALCYCALNFASKQYAINDLCLVNPRRGTYFQERIEILCRDLSGSSSTELFYEILRFCSEGAELGY